MWGLKGPVSRQISTAEEDLRRNKNVTPIHVFYHEKY